MMNVLLPLAQFPRDFDHITSSGRGSDIGWDMLRMIAVNLPAALIFGALGIAMLLIGFKLFDKMTPRIDFEAELTEKRNYPLAIVVAAFLISIAFIIHAVVR